MKWVDNFKHQWRIQPILQVATMSVLTGTLTVFALGLWAHQNAAAVLSGWGKDVKFKVYLSENATEEHIQKIIRTLENSGMFKAPTLVSKDQALSRFKDRINKYLPGFVDDSGFANPLPRSIETEIQGQLMDTSHLSRMMEEAKKLERTSGVDQVSYGQGWIENYSSVLQVFETVSLFFLIILLGGAIFVVGNSIHNSISQRRDEIEILELFGATQSAITRPFVIEGLITSGIASMLALLFCYVIYFWQAKLFENNLPFWGVQTTLQFLNVGRIFVFLFIGTAIGGLAAFVWTRRISTGWAAADGSK